MTNLEYDKLVGCDDDYNYCDMCDTRLVTSQECQSGRCSDCIAEAHRRELTDK